MQTGKEIWELWERDGKYLCTCGASGLYFDEQTQDVETCPECDAVTEYMRENKLGVYAQEEEIKDYGDGIPF